MTDAPLVNTEHEATLLRTLDLRKTYAPRGRWGGHGPTVESLRGVDLVLHASSSLALIGASGSGKSTLARCLAHLEKPDSGEIWFAGKEISLGSRVSTDAPWWREIQLVFQDSALSLNPRLTALDIVAEPLLITNWGTGSKRKARAIELMRQVGLPLNALHRVPGELSGGQRRRLSIARALALEPKILILDESLAGLDLSTQAQIANLLLELQDANALSYLWISHDLALMARLAPRIAVIDEGRIVEVARSPELFANPQSRQAQILVEATLARQARTS